MPYLDDRKHYYWPSYWPQIFVLFAVGFCGGVAALMFCDGDYWLGGVNALFTLANCWGFWRIRNARQKLRKTYQKAGIFNPY